MPPKNALAAHAAKLQQSWGTRAVMAPVELDLLPTGSLVTDYILRGGWPVGRIAEILGPPDSGKSTLAISSMREAQRSVPGKGVCYIDMEGTFSYDYAGALGLACADEDIASGRWSHMYPRDSEDASDMARQQAMTGLYSIIVLDSVGGMESRRAFNKDAEEVTVADNAKIITRMVKHLASLARMHQAVILLINQPRAVISGQSVPDQSAGPKAMQHQTSVKIQMSKGPETPIRMKIEEGDDPEVVAVQVKTRLVRSKIAPVGRQGEFWICNRHTEKYGPPGIFAADEYATLGVKYGVIRQGGSWYELPGGEKIQGRDAIGPFLQAHPGEMEAIRAGVLAKAG
jgi:recombination protein RecA